MIFILKIQKENCKKNNNNAKMYAYFHRMLVEFYLVFKTNNKMKQFCFVYSIDTLGSANFRV